MKLKMFRCGICDHWNHVSRNHCSNCASTRRVNGMHFSYTALQHTGKLLQTVRSVPSDLALRFSLNK